MARGQGRGRGNRRKSANQENDESKPAKMSTQFPVEVWTTIFSYLDFETLQKKTILVCKLWYAMIRSDPFLSGHLALHPPLKPPNFRQREKDMKADDRGEPGRESRSFDYITTALTATFASARDVNSKLKSWTALKSLEIPNVQDLMQLNFKPLKNLTKVTINAKFPTKKALPYWLKVTQISFDPSKNEDLINLGHTSRLAVILDSEDFPNYQQDFDHSKIAKMSNLETLYFYWRWYDGDFEFLKPLFKTLQSNCPKINSLKIDLGSSPDHDMTILIDLIQEHFPQISTVDIHDCDDVQVPIHMIGQMFGFKNMKKIALNIMSMESGRSFIQNKYLTEMIVDDTSDATCQDYFEQKAKSSQIEEIHLYSSGFLEPHFLLKYKELFPRLEKLTIDPKERFSGRKLSDDYCDDSLWEIRQLTEILELLASIKHLNIWKFKLELMEGKPPERQVLPEVERIFCDCSSEETQKEIAVAYCEDCKDNICETCYHAHLRVRLTKDHRISWFSRKKHPILNLDSFAKMEIFREAVRIINDKFPLDSEFEIYERKMKCSITKKKWKEAYIRYPANPDNYSKAYSHAGSTAGSSNNSSDEDSDTEYE